MTKERWAPKHGHERVIPLTDPELVHALKRQVARSTGPWVFGTGDNWKGNGGRWRNSRLLRRLSAQLRRAGIPHGGLHTFRHSFLTRIANDPAMPLTHVMRIAGHRSAKTAMLYQHPSVADISRSLAQVKFNQMSDSVPDRSGTEGKAAMERQAQQLDDGRDERRRP